jgi:hypothetical protein
MSFLKVQFNVANLDAYIVNDCRIFDKETMNLDEYFLHGRIVEKVEHVVAPNQVGKTENVSIILRPIEKKKTIQQVNSSNNYSIINLPERNSPNNSKNEKNEKDLANNNYLKSKTNIENANSLYILEDKDIKDNSTHYIKEKIQPTSKDFDELSIHEELLYDKRPFNVYVKDAIIKEHRIINIIFKRSLLHPFFIKMNKLTFELSMGLAINALLYTADYIDKRATANDKVIYIFNSV